MFAPLTGSTVTISRTALPGAPAAGQLPAPEQTQDGEQEPNKVENMIDISRIEGQVRESSVKKVGEVVNAHPEEALAILRSWLHQPV